MRHWFRRIPLPSNHSTLPASPDPLDLALRLSDDRYPRLRLALYRLLDRFFGACGPGGTCVWLRQHMAGLFPLLPPYGQRFPDKEPRPDRYPLPTRAESNSSGYWLWASVRGRRETVLRTGSCSLFFPRTSSARRSSCSGWATEARSVGLG